MSPIQFNISARDNWVVISHATYMTLYELNQLIEQRGVTINEFQSGGDLTLKPWWWYRRKLPQSIMSIFRATKYYSTGSQVNKCSLHVQAQSLMVLALLPCSETSASVVDVITYERSTIEHFYLGLNSSKLCKIVVAMTTSDHPPSVHILHDTIWISNT